MHLTRIKMVKYLDSKMENEASIDDQTALMSQKVIPRIAISLICNQFLGKQIWRKKCGQQYTSTAGGRWKR